MRGGRHKIPTAKVDRLVLEEHHAITPYSKYPRVLGHDGNPLLKSEVSTSRLLARFLVFTGCLVLCKFDFLGGAKRVHLLQALKGCRSLPFGRFLRCGLLHPELLSPRAGSTGERDIGRGLEGEFIQTRRLVWVPGPSKDPICFFWEMGLVLLGPPKDPPIFCSAKGPQNKGYKGRKNGVLRGSR